MLMIIISSSSSISISISIIIIITTTTIIIIIIIAIVIVILIIIIIVVVVIIVIIPYEDKVDVITPINIFVKGGGGFLTPCEDKLMLLFPYSTYLSQGVVDLLIPYEDKWV